MLKKSAEDILNIMCIEKQAGVFGDTVKEGFNAFKNTAKNSLGGAGDAAKDLYGDVKRATGLEKFTPKHDVGLNAIKGAGAGAVTGAVGGVATNNGDDSFGSALKGGALGAVGGAALGGGLSHHLNVKDAKAFADKNNAFKRGFGLGSVTGGVAGSVGTDGLKNGVDAVKNAAPGNVKNNLTDMYNKVQSKVSDATKNVNDVYGKVQDTAKNVSDKAQNLANGATIKTKDTGSKFVDSVKEKINKLKGHQ